LLLAAQEGAILAAATLLAGGAQVDAVSGYRNMPLFTAVFNSGGRGELIQLEICLVTGFPFWSGRTSAGALRHG
jgi:hypothetical protein